MSLLLSATQFHRPESKTTLSYSTPRKSRSHGSLLDPIVALARRPIALVETLLEELRPLPSADTFVHQELESKRALLYLQLRDACTLGEWEAAAADLDKVEGNDLWKLQDDSGDYDHELVQARLQQLNDAKLSRDPQRLLFLIRTSLTRHLGGMGNIRLYKHTHIGTKHLIERYIESALESISLLVESTRRPGPSSPDARHLLDQVLLARQSFGRSALLLSGGGTFGMNHNGVVKSLWEANLLPRIISGASAGSIVCAVLCTKTDDEVPTVLDEFVYGDLDVFTQGKGDDSLLRQAARFMKYGALFDISNLIRVMKGMIGDMTFQEAYNRTRRILNICVSTASLYELPRLLNYVTAPNVLIWSAVAASCSVPLVFSPAPLLAKDPRTGDAVPWNSSPAGWIDGSVDNDLPMTRLAEMFNVNHFIVSQVNPHVVPFLVREEDGIALDVQKSEGHRETESTWMNTFAALAKDEAMHRMHILSEFGVLPNVMTKMRSILSQKYSGDITILPEVSYADFAKVLQNPTTEFMLQATTSGERATWPKMSRIRNHCAIELALDDAVQQLRAHVAFSQSQVDLRSFGTERLLSRTGSDGGRRHGSRTHRKRQRVSNNSAVRPESISADMDLSIAVPSTSTRRRDKIANRPPTPPTIGNAPRQSRRLPVSFQLTPRSTSNARRPSDEAIGACNSQTSLTSTEGLDMDANDPGSSDEEEEASTCHLRTRSKSSAADKLASSLSAMWPSTSMLFPHASQPATPLQRLASSGSSYFDSPTPPQPLTPAANSSSSLMWRSSWPMEPELAFDKACASVSGAASPAFHSARNSRRNSRTALSSAATGLRGRRATDSGRARALSMSGRT